MSSKGTPETVAVVGGTGRVGREVVKILASCGIRVKCLVRYDPPSPQTQKSLDPNTATSKQVAAHLASLDEVTLIKGHVGDKESLTKLLEGCSACFALFGPLRMSKLSDLWRSVEDADPNHGKTVNYVGVQNILEAAIASETCKRIVRITGKGEKPWSMISIIINMFGSMGKGWNYEGEQLLRSCKEIDYTIIRPGLLVESVEGNKVLALQDDGRDDLLKVSAVARSDIAMLCVDCLNYKNAARSTLVAMNVESGKGEETYTPLLSKVKPDSRSFPPTLIQEHKRAVRSLVVILLAIVVSITAGLVSIVKSFPA